MRRVRQRVIQFKKAVPIRSCIVASCHHSLHSFFTQGLTDRWKRLAPTEKLVSKRVSINRDQGLPPSARQPAHQSMTQCELNDLKRDAAASTLHDCAIEVGFPWKDGQLRMGIEQGRQKCCAAASHTTNEDRRRAWFLLQALRPRQTVRITTLHHYEIFGVSANIAFARASGEICVN